jgi:hypothetical protein
MRPLPQSVSLLCSLPTKPSLSHSYLRATCRTHLTISSNCRLQVVIYVLVENSRLMKPTGLVPDSVRLAGARLSLHMHNE